MPPIAGRRWAWYALGLTMTALAGCSWLRLEPPPPVPPGEIAWPAVAERTSLTLLQELPLSSLTPQPAPEPEPLIHTVRRPGETLIAIARWYTATSGNWRRVAAANPAIEPTRIHVGDAILIPGSLVVRRDPMPAQRIRSRVQPKPQQVKSSAPAAAKQVRRIAPELFGPIGTKPSDGPPSADRTPPPLETLE